jgi:hypothetical protein
LSNSAINLMTSTTSSFPFIPLTTAACNNPASARSHNASRTCSESQKNYPSTLSSMQSMSVPTQLGCHHRVTRFLFFWRDSLNRTFQICVFASQVVQKLTFELPLSP